jgi:hypothetical protein
MHTQDIWKVDGHHHLTLLRVVRWLGGEGATKTVQTNVTTKQKVQIRSGQ